MRSVAGSADVAGIAAQNSIAAIANIVASFIGRSYRFVVAMWSAKRADSHIEPVFPKKDQAIDYAQNRACFRLLHDPKAPQ